MLSRNKSQEKIMVCLYTYLFNTKFNLDNDVKFIIENTFEETYDNVDIYSKEVIIKSIMNEEEIDQLIENNLSEKLKLSRINLVAHAILLFSIGEYKYVGEIKKAEMIDVAVNLAKAYLDDNEYKFINAVLDKVL